MKPVKMYTFKLERGDVVDIDGLPYEYLGNDVVAGYTDPAVVEWVVGEAPSEVTPCATGCSCGPDELETAQALPESKPAAEGPATGLPGEPGFFKFDPKALEEAIKNLPVLPPVPYNPNTNPWRWYDRDIDAMPMIGGGCCGGVQRGSIVFGGDKC